MLFKLVWSSFPCSAKCWLPFGVSSSSFLIQVFVAWMICCFQLVSLCFHLWFFWEIEVFLRCCEFSDNRPKQGVNKWPLKWGTTKDQERAYHKSTSRTWPQTSRNPAECLACKPTTHQRTSQVVIIPFATSSKSNSPAILAFKLLPSP